MSQSVIASKCKFTFPWPQTAGLNLYAWQLNLGPNEAYPFPDTLPPGFIGVTWKGSPNDSSDSPECTGTPSGRWMGPISASQELRNSGGDLAQVAVVGIAEEPISLPSPIVPLGASELEFGNVDNPPSFLTAIVYELLIEDTTIAAECWGRPGFFLSSNIGPLAKQSFANPFPLIDEQPRQCDKVAPAFGTSMTLDELPDLAVFPLVRFPWLSFRPGVSNPDREVSPYAMLVDFHMEGDPDWTDEPPLGENGCIEGCSWRCKG